ncbi:MAG TPA: hypothetical protein VET48_12775 [Steroidobacteraceae bacterium]|nr:hypothetical protein [Steroidobacteraceae bacterium]
MRITRVVVWLSGVLMGIVGLATSAGAETGLGIRGGTFGIGVDFDVSLLDKLSLRLAYNGFNYNQTVDDTNVRYDGKLKISSFSSLLEWYPVGGGFRLSAGAIASTPKIDLTGTPTGGTFQIGNNTYTAAQVGSLNGTLKFGNSIAPYVGLGYGNVVSAKHRVSFLFDVGAVYGGTPDVSIVATCGAGVPPATCTQLQNDTAVEIQKLKNNASNVEWYPVVSLGLGIRF